MPGFKELEGDMVILIENGIYKEAPLYERNGLLFAKYKGGFIRLKEDGSTSSRSRFEELIYEGDLFRDPFGRLCVSEAKGRKLIADRTGPLLLGVAE